MKFGFEEIDGRLKIQEVRNYLRVRGWTNNSLTKARKRDPIQSKEDILNAVNCCDFCGMPLSGVSYEILTDGRSRCNDCSSSSIRTVDEFKDLFYQILQLMEEFYGIKYRVPLGIRVEDARFIAKARGIIFTPSTGIAPRCLGYASKQGNKMSVVVENGSPRLVAIDTLVHEMTHIWQYLNWNDEQIRTIYKMDEDLHSNIARDVVYEGMAMWSAIQYLYFIGEVYYADIQVIKSLNRDDIYGLGFRLYSEQYPLIRDSGLLLYSPFVSFPPLEPEKVKAAVIEFCREDEEDA